MVTETAVDLTKQINQALNTKGANGPCSLCGHNTWHTLPYAIKIFTAPTVPELPVSNTFIPSVSRVCANCGNTHVLNLHVLGMGHLIPKDWYRS